MARVPTVRRLSVDAIPEVPDWFRNSVLYVFNQLIESEHNSLDKGITVADNLDTQVKEVQFTTASDYELNNNFTELKFKKNLGGSAVGVNIAKIWIKDAESTILTGSISLDWTEQNDQIKIRFISGLADSTTYVVRVVAWR